MQDIAKKLKTAFGQSGLPRKQIWDKIILSPVDAYIHRKPPFNYCFDKEIIEHWHADETQEMLIGLISNNKKNPIIEYKELFYYCCFLHCLSLFTWTFQANSQVGFSRITELLYDNNKVLSQVPLPLCASNDDIRSSLARYSIWHGLNKHDLEEIAKEGRRKNKYIAIASKLLSIVSSPLCEQFKREGSEANIVMRGLAALLSDLIFYTESNFKKFYEELFYKLEQQQIAFSDPSMLIEDTAQHNQYYSADTGRWEIIDESYKIDLLENQYVLGVPLSSLLTFPLLDYRFKRFPFDNLQSNANAIPQKHFEHVKVCIHILQLHIVANLIRNIFGEESYNQALTLWNELITEEYRDTIMQMLKYLGYHYEHISKQPYELYRCKYSRRECDTKYLAIANIIVCVMKQAPYHKEYTEINIGRTADIITIPNTNGLDFICVDAIMEAEENTLNYYSKKFKETQVDMTK